MQPSPSAAQSRPRRILVVDDDPLALRLVERLLVQIGVTVSTASNGNAALAILEQTPVGMVLTDLRMDGMDGAALMQAVRSRWAGVPVVVMTTYGTIETAVELMRDGATDFVTKPLDARTLERCIDRIFREQSLVGEVEDLKRRLVAAGEGRQLMGAAPVFRQLLDRLPMAARSDAPVLVRGETGTGKELVARTLHTLSTRASEPFVAINCGAIPGELLDSEMFGHVRGAFTDARKDKTGLVVEADGGTLFLDEIGDMPLDLQVKLLRFLQEGEVRPVGSTRTRTVDVRVIAATHKDLRKAIEAGTFREDLFYRLDVVPLEVPPLRARLSDVPLLAEHLLLRHVRGTSRPNLRFSAAALDRLVSHRWPGNVRELENVVRRAAVFATGIEIGPELIEIHHRQPVAPGGDSTGSSNAVNFGTSGTFSVPPAAATSMGGATQFQTAVDLNVPLRDAKESLVDEFQRAYLKAALEAADGVVAQAARIAGKDRKSFWELMQRYEIAAEEYR